jgi:hypothetical protein
MPIVPETKDWTWVLQRRCPECGFEASAFPREQVSQLIRDNAAAWRELLGTALDRGDGDAALRQRPSDDRWSGLEYACHVRDVFRIYDYRLGLMLTRDEPTFPNWDQDESAVAERYNEQDPATVTDELLAAAETLAGSFEGVGGQAWDRTGIRCDGVHFTVESFARYMVHDPIHHVVDVRQGLDRVAEQG